MIAATRRTVLAGGFAGALAVPTLAGLAHWRWRHGEGGLLLHDPALAAGRRFAAAGAAAGGTVLALEGDRIRFARRALDRRPALIAGVSRHADALLIEDVAQEAGYASVAVLHGQGDSCGVRQCDAGWRALGRMAEGSGSNWAEALAVFAARPGDHAATTLAAAPSQTADSGLVIGWLLAARA